MLAEVGRRLGYGLVSVVNALNPEVIVIGGGAVAAGELLLEPARAVVAERALPPAARAGADRRRPLRRRVGHARRGAAGARAGERVSGRLVVCPTPIGNLEDVTLRVLAALREADVVACEDTRRTRVLLDRYGVKARLVSYHEHNERARASELAERMRAGETVALVSDAGMPLVSDPGYVLVRACVAAGVPVEVLPGPSAAITALVASGLPAEAWHFHGFLPRKQGELKRLLSEHGGTLVAFESPRRVPATLKLAGRARPRARGGRLPRADQGARGDRARQRLRVGRALCRRRRRRGRSCSCSVPRRRPRWGRATLRVSTPCAGSSRPVRGHVRPRGWWPS